MLRSSKSRVFPLDQTSLHRQLPAERSTQLQCAANSNGRISKDRCLWRPIGSHPGLGRSCTQNRLRRRFRHRSWSLFHRSRSRSLRTYSLSKVRRSAARTNCERLLKGVDRRTASGTARIECRRNEKTRLEFQARGNRQWSAPGQGRFAAPPP